MQRVGYISTILTMEKEKNTPALRFPKFEGEWERKMLRDITVGGFSNGAFNDPKKVGKGYRIINVKDMYVDGTINIDNLTRVDLDVNEFSKNRVEYGDIFFTRSSLVKEGIAYSNVILSDAEDLTFDGHLIRMRPNKCISSSSFLAYNFTTPNVRTQFIKRGKTTTMTTIGQEDVASVEILLPTLPEQQKIASFLTEVDEKLAQLKQKKALLEQYKKGVMQKIFSQEIRFRDENGNEFPYWEEKRLGEVTKLQCGYAFKSELFQTEGIPVIRISNISNKNNNIDLTNIVYYNEFKNSDNFIVRNGDLILAMSGATTGKSSIYNLPYIAYLNQRVGLFKPITDNLYYQYLIQFVFSENFQKQLNAVLVTGAQPNISSSDIEALNFPLPSIAEQTKIANFLSAIDEKIGHCSLQIEKVEQWKKGLLQKMFV